MIVDKTKEEVGKGYQILGAKNLKISEDTPFLGMLSGGKRGIKRWVNVIKNAFLIFILFIVIISTVFAFGVMLYDFMLFSYRLIN